jgi:ribosomal protein S21
MAIGPINRSIEEEHRVQVFVRDNNVDQALKVLKKKMQRDGVFREMRLRKHYGPRLHRQQALALQLFAGELAGAADGFRLLPDSPLGGFFRSEGLPEEAPRHAHTASDLRTMSRSIKILAQNPPTTRSTRCYPRRRSNPSKSRTSWRS